MKPLLILDQHFRRLEELFHPATYERLTALCDIVGGVNWPMPRDRLEAALPKAAFLVAAHPALDGAAIARAGKLRAVIEVAGAFRPGLDYAACFARGIEVLSCAPGFRSSVAEMAVGMMIAGARGLVDQHEAFRSGAERWLDDRPATDFTLYGQDVGFVGFGEIARECARLLAPFRPTIRAFDPWLDAETLTAAGATSCSLAETIASSRCLVVAANPTADNQHLIGEAEIDAMPPGALVVLISRAHLVDFDALVAAASRGRIRLATDVFPSEPMAADAPVRRAANVILSPHRAAAVPGGRHPIGDMIVADIESILGGRPERALQRADPARIESIIGAAPSPALAEAGIT